MQSFDGDALMLSTAWNEEEDHALRRLPWRARVVYLQGIRRYMDYQTGWAGKRRILSYQFFLELLECSEHTTSPDPIVTKRGLQTIFLMLERVGLVEWPRGSSTQRGVVFRCLLANTDDSVQKQAVPKRYPSGTQEAVPQEPSKQAYSSDVAVPIHVAPQQGQAVPPPVIRVSGKERTALFSPPSVEEVDRYIKAKGYAVDAEAFVAYYESNGWMVGKAHMKKWQAACTTWHKRNETPKLNGHPPQSPQPKPSAAKAIDIRDLLS
jgi:hypothetical protein